MEEYDLTFPTARKEHLDNKHLQCSHRNHKPALQQAESEYPPLGAADGAEVPVLARAEVLLLSYERGYLARKLQDRLFHAGELFRGRAGFLGEAGTGFVFDLCGVSAYVSRTSLEEGDGLRGRTAISKSTSLSETVDMLLSKQKRYSPASLAVKTKSPWRSFSPSRTTRSLPASFAGP